jgi:hypothetical protein
MFRQRLEQCRNPGQQLAVAQRQPLSQMTQVRLVESVPVFRGIRQLVGQEQLTRNPTIRSAAGVDRHRRLAPERFKEGLTQRDHARAAGMDQRSIDVKQQNMHLSFFTLPV